VLSKLQYKKNSQKLIWKKLHHVKFNMESQSTTARRSHNSCILVEINMGLLSLLLKVQENKDVSCTTKHIAWTKCGKNGALKA